MVNNQKVVQLAQKHSTPLFVYDVECLINRAKEIQKAPMTFGHTVRYAVKANPFPEIIKIFAGHSLHFDTSSTYEAAMLLKLGVPGPKISLSSQTLDGPLAEVLEAGVLPVATSLHQMEILHQQAVRQLAVRVNPGVGSGGNKRTTVGGPASSFGIWHEYLGKVTKFSATHDMTIDRLHTHVGSGTDPNVWRDVMKHSLDIVEMLTDVKTLDIGGGYKIARVEGEAETDMSEVLSVFDQELKAFAEKTGRKIKLEIEPGTYLVANAGYLVASVMDIVDTGSRGFMFLRLDTGMNDILRPSLYGAQHPIEVINDSKEHEDYIVVGHNCESGDILTPAPGDPEGLLPRRLKKASIGDLVVVGGAGAYCASMSASGYNSFPDAQQVILT